MISAAQLSPKRLLEAAWKMIKLVDGGEAIGDDNDRTLRELAIAIESAANDIRAERQKRAEDELRAGRRIGRNDPCPCGSGAKWKKCHGRGVS